MPLISKKGSATETCDSLLPTYPANVLGHRLCRLSISANHQDCVVTRNRTYNVCESRCVDSRAYAWSSARFGIYDNLVPYAFHTQNEINDHTLQVQIFRKRVSSLRKLL